MTNHLSALQTIDANVKIPETRIDLAVKDDDRFDSVGDFFVGEAEFFAFSNIRNYMELGYSAFLLILPPKPIELWSQEIASIVQLPYVRLREEPGAIAVFTVNGANYEIPSLSPTNLALIEQSLRGASLLAYADSPSLAGLQRALAMALHPGSTVSINGGEAITPNRSTKVMVEVRQGSNALSLDNGLHCARVELPYIGQEYIGQGDGKPTVFKNLDLTVTSEFLSKTNQAVSDRLAIALADDSSESDDSMLKHFDDHRDIVTQGASKIAMLIKRIESSHDEAAAIEWGVAIALSGAIQAFIGDKFAMEDIYMEFRTTQEMSATDLNQTYLRECLDLDFHEGAVGEMVTALYREIEEDQ